MTNFATLESIQAYAATHKRFNIQVKGDCMEKRDIYDGDIVSVDTTKMPIPIKDENNKDICLMYDKKTGCVGVKEYLGAWGDMQMVSTCPIPDHSKGILGGWAFSASHILGIVYACHTPDWKLKWERDISGRPAELSRKQGIKNGNTCAPVSTRKAAPIASKDNILEAKKVPGFFQMALSYKHIANDVPGLGDIK